VELEFEARVGAGAQSLDAHCLQLAVESRDALAVGGARTSSRCPKADIVLSSIMNAAAMKSSSMRPSVQESGASTTPFSGGAAWAATSNNRVFVFPGASMATLHLMVGLPCSGKTTHARRLAREANALLLTLDVWHLTLFGDDVGHADHDERHQSIEKIMWDVAKHVLAMGGDVILDYGCWARIERDDYRNRAKELGASFTLHYMDVPYSELYRRLAIRNRAPAEGVFVIPKTEMDKYIIIFQPPTEDELV